MDCGGLNIDSHYDYRRETRKVRLVLIYIKEGKNPLGSDYTILSDLKTLRGVRNRYKKHMENMKKRGCASYIVVPYYSWKTNDIEDIIKNYPHYKLEVE